MAEYTREELESMHAENVAKRRASAEARARARLVSICTKKIQTVMIGSLAAFEDNFGYLWGHGKPERDLSEQELIFRQELWEPVRATILHNGNNQIRLVTDELKHYSGIQWDKYKTQLVVPKEKDNE